MKRQLILATNNAGKIKDYYDIASFFPITLLPQMELKVPEVEETGTTFIENALLKAHNAAAYTNLPVLAEDSGLIVDALHGAPGLYSARYAGVGASQSQNIEKLLSDLAKIPHASRKAKLYVATVLLRHPKDPAPIIAEAVIHGEILLAPQGNNSFGYLPVFYLPEYGCTAGEISLTEKNRISHRGKAARQIFTQFLAECDADK